MALLGNTAEASERGHRGHHHHGRGDDHHHGRRPDKRIVGYYPSWAGDYTPHDVPYHKLTHLNYAFLETEANGEVKLAVTGDSAPEVLAEFETLTHERHRTSFMLSIADFGSNMSAVAASPTPASGSREPPSNSFDGITSTASTSTGSTPTGRFGRTTRRTSRCCWRSFAED